MVHALYLALHLFISGYFAPSLIHAGDTQAKTPRTSREWDRLRTTRNTAALAVPLKHRTPPTPGDRDRVQHSGGGSPAQTAHTVDTPLTFNREG
jgi:hypothetical protein